MGQFQSIVHRRSRHSPHQLKSFPDLSNFPPEVAVSVLSHLNATDLCLAACVWKHLADNELLWQRFVISKTSLCSACKFTLEGAFSFRSDIVLCDYISLTGNTILNAVVIYFN